MGVRPRLIVALAALAVSAASACKSKPPPEPPPAPAPVDRLAPGELPLGTEKAFALPLPITSVVLQSYGGSYFVRTGYSAEEIVNFIRLHVKGGKVVAGTSSTTFTDVVVPAEPARHLDIDIRRSTSLNEARTEIRVTDVTPPPDDPNLSEADRWKKVGLTPDGKLLDPKHLH